MRYILETVSTRNSVVPDLVVKRVREAASEEWPDDPEDMFEAGSRSEDVDEVLSRLYPSAEGGTRVAIRKNNKWDYQRDREIDDTKRFVFSRPIVQNSNDCLAAVAEHAPIIYDCSSRYSKPSDLPEVESVTYKNRYLGFFRETGLQALDNELKDYVVHPGTYLLDSYSQLRAAVYDPKLAETLRKEVGRRSRARANKQKKRQAYMEEAKKVRNDTSSMLCNIHDLTGCVFDSVFFVPRYEYQGEQLQVGGLEYCRNNWKIDDINRSLSYFVERPYVAHEDYPEGVCQQARHYCQRVEATICRLELLGRPVSRKMFVLGPSMFTGYIPQPTGTRLAVNNYCLRNHKELFTLARENIEYLRPFHKEMLHIEMRSRQSYIPRIKAEQYTEVGVAWGRVLDSLLKLVGAVERIAIWVDKKGFYNKKKDKKDDGERVSEEHAEAHAEVRDTRDSAVQPDAVSDGRQSDGDCESELVVPAYPANALCAAAEGSGVCEGSGLDCGDQGVAEVGVVGAEAGEPVAV